MLTHGAVRTELVRHATSQQPITYGELGARLSLEISDLAPRVKPIRTLDDINRAEHTSGLLQYSPIATTCYVQSLFRPGVKRRVLMPAVVSGEAALT